MWSLVVVGGGDGDKVVKNRFLGFLIWQSLQSTLLFLVSKSLLVSPPLAPSLSSLLAFLLFHLSLLLFSASLSVIASPPQPHPPASPSDLALGLLRSLFLSGARPLPDDFRRRAKVSLGFLLFVTASALSGFLAVVSVCWSCHSFAVLRWSQFLETLGFRGFVVGLFYGVFHLYMRRWVLQFPIIQRPPFFSFKMGIPSAIGQALKLLCAAYFFSALLALFLSNESKSQITISKFLVEQMIFIAGSFTVILCWELSRHLHQVLHTKRFIFAPPKGSAAAETNPSEPLLAALEQSTPGSLLQHLAFLDLLMVCERNVDTWRRTAFFEETGETYKRTIALCLRPLEQFTSKLDEGLDWYTIDKSSQLSHQLRSPTESRRDSRLEETFYSFQLCTWCARIVGSLTVRSHTEDRFGVAQLSGSNAAVISTLLSCLLAVETFMGKKSNLQSTGQAMGPSGIKWATFNTGRGEAVAAGVTVMGKKRGNPQYSKAYAMADIVRTSIYYIVVTFQDEMLNSAKAGLLEKDWILDSKPLYGTREILSQKLRLFLDFRAT